MLARPTKGETTNGMDQATCTGGDGRSGGTVERRTRRGTGRRSSLGDAVEEATFEAIDRRISLGRGLAFLAGTTSLVLADECPGRP
jgi:hypothetical protein